MRVAVFSRHKYDQSAFEEANSSFKHELVFFTGALESTTASLAVFARSCGLSGDRIRLFPGGEE